MTNPHTPDSSDTLRALADVIAARRSADPSRSYVAKLVHKGLDSMLKKVGEEATELVIAAKDGDREQIVYEAADLWFHSLIVLSQFGLGPDEVLAELRRREGLSGLQEYAQRNQPGQP